MRFEVLLNGESLCIVGLGEGQFSVRVFSSWCDTESVARHSVEWNDRLDSLLVESGEPALDVVGLDSEYINQRTFWIWLQQQLRMGDEVVVRVIGNGATTPPKGRKRLNSDPIRHAASAFGSA